MAVDDGELLARAEQALTEIKVNQGLSEEHAAVLAALRIRLKGSDTGSLEDLLQAAARLRTRQPRRRTGRGPHAGAEALAGRPVRRRPEAETRLAELTPCGSWKELKMTEDELIALLQERQNNGRTAYLTFGELVAMVPADQMDEWRAVLAKVRSADAARDAREDAD